MALLAWGWEQILGILRGGKKFTQRRESSVFTWRKRGGEQVLQKYNLQRLLGFAIQILFSKIIRIILLLTWIKPVFSLIESDLLFAKLLKNIMITLIFGTINSTWLSSFSAALFGFICLTIRSAPVSDPNSAELKRHQTQFLNTSTGSSQLSSSLSKYSRVRLCLDIYQLRWKIF